MNLVADCTTSLCLWKSRCVAEDCFPQFSQSFGAVLSAGKKEGEIQIDECSKTPSIHGHKVLWRLTTVAQTTHVFTRPNIRLHCPDVVKRPVKFRPSARNVPGPKGNARHLKCYKI